MGPDPTTSGLYSNHDHYDHCTPPYPQDLGVTAVLQALRLAHAPSPLGVFLPACERIYSVLTSHIYENHGFSRFMLLTSGP
jgi:hypothetical protein